MGPALLLLGWLFLCGVAGAAEGWDPALVRALGRVPGRPLDWAPATLQLAGEAPVKVRLSWGPVVPDSLEQARRAAWLAQDAARRLPAPGDPVTFLDRYEAGRPLVRRFVGFDGPLLVLEGGGQEEVLRWEEAHVALEGRPWTGTWTRAQWPPSRRPLLATQDGQSRWIWPAEIEDLRVGRRIDQGEVMVLALGVGIGILLYGFTHMELDWGTGIQ